MLVQIVDVALSAASLSSSVAGLPTPLSHASSSSRRYSLLWGAGSAAADGSSLLSDGNDASLDFGLLAKRLLLLRLRLTVTAVAGTEKPCTPGERAALNASVEVAISLGIGMVARKIRAARHGGMARSDA